MFFHYSLFSSSGPPLSKDLEVFPLSSFLRCQLALAKIPADREGRYKYQGDWIG
jgi:hypothetical protein